MKTGKRKYDELPARVGLTDVDALRYGVTPVIESFRFNAPTQKIRLY